MANPLFNQSQNNNPFAQIINEAQNLKKTLKGNPRQEVERLLQSGQMSQSQFNQLAQIANQILPFLPK